MIVASDTAPGVGGRGSWEEHTYQRGQLLLGTRITAVRGRGQFCHSYTLSKRHWKCISFCEIRCVCF